MTAIGQRGIYSDAVAQIEEQTNTKPSNLATVAMWPLIGWLENDAEEELAARILDERPGDTDIGAAREQVAEVICALLGVIYREYGVPG